MHTKLFASLALAGAVSAQQAHMMRFACSQLTVERLDPLVNPGMVGTPHTHQIVGGNSFQPDMKPVEYDLPTKSSCTSCTFSEVGSRTEEGHELVQTDFSSLFVKSGCRKC